MLFSIEPFFLGVLLGIGGFAFVLVALALISFRQDSPKTSGIRSWVQKHRVGVLLSGVFILAILAVCIYFNQPYDCGAPLESYRFEEEGTDGNPPDLRVLRQSC